MRRMVAWCRKRCPRQYGQITGVPPLQRANPIGSRNKLERIRLESDGQLSELPLVSRSPAFRPV